MQFRQFGRTGLTVSRLCIGTGTFGKQTDETEAHKILDKAAEDGVNFIDVADIYPPGAEVGGAEIITGRWLSNKRGSFILGTKGGGRMGPAAWDAGNSRKRLLDAIDASLRRLNTDYVDLYQLHMDDPATPLDEVAEAMDAIVRAGKARYIGVSNFLAYRLARALGRQDTLKLTRFVSAQPRYNLLFREVERELLPLAEEDRLAVIPFNPLAGGLLSGRYRHGDTPEKGRFSSELGGFGAMYHARYWHEREFETVGKVRQIAERQRTPMSTLSIAWVLANPAITSVILGASRIAHLTDTLAAAEYCLDCEVKAQLDEVSIEYRRGDAGK
ncbi:aldo/keto reductase [Paraburkholderia humisilvae]|uniref:1-deoxyxylulose-5-phosphate synthase YajO n=1 Tax=Paraburkholderia humisilvae TaxID=627669 RepID=A0A6J5EQA1_9BURK|nr:aldo/keto reductase [Paraburkholderia humisilvae]CAB3767175.1 1-deoxyxylulose-5-phosphate synthase YajO [Paraburkholderia humisilvae]